jgi:hypothetical protein
MRELKSQEFSYLHPFTLLCDFFFTIFIEHRLYMGGDQLNIFPLVLLMNGCPQDMTRRLDWSRDLPK